MGTYNFPNNVEQGHDFSEHNFSERVYAPTTVDENIIPFIVTAAFFICAVIQAAAVHYTYDPQTATSRDR